MFAYCSCYMRAADCGSAGLSSVWLFSFWLSSMCVLIPRARLKEEPLYGVCCSHGKGCKRCLLNCLELAHCLFYPHSIDRSFILLLIPLSPTPNPSEHPLASPSKPGRVGYSLLSVLIVPISCPYQSPTALPCRTEMVFFYRQWTPWGRKFISESSVTGISL